MINPHVHCRDWEQAYKGQTIAHALTVAERTGVSAIIDPLNTNPSTSKFELVEKRLADAEKVKSRVFYGCLPVLTSNPNQIKEMVKTTRTFAFAQRTLNNSAVVGLKVFTDVFSDEELGTIMHTLVDENYSGVLVCHCEDKEKFKSQLWDPQNPISHSWARPEEAETAAIRKMVSLYSYMGFEGRLHIYHVSTPESLNVITQAKDRGIPITSEVTPHHCLLAAEDIPAGLEGLLFKVNPPLRPRKSQRQMLDLLKSGYLDSIGSDCAAHTAAEKTGKTFDAKGNPQYASGFPGQPFYPIFINYLKSEGFGNEQLHRLTHTNIERIFGIHVSPFGINQDLGLHKEYEVDVYKTIREKFAGIT
jgi:dihydroorotase